jgi:hypothetical protein
MLVQEFKTEIEAINAEFSDTFNHLSPAQMNYKPNSAVWSVAQNIEHIIKTSDSYLPTLTGIHDGSHQTSFLGRIKWWSKMCGKMILKSVNPDRLKKIKTFPLWQPPMSDSSETILEDFFTNQANFVEETLNNREEIESLIVVSSPANVNIVYTMSRALEIITTHQRRHLNQAKEMLPLIEAYGQS